MSPNPKDTPKEWRRSALLAMFGLAVISTVLRVRHYLSNSGWVVILLMLLIAATIACLKPRWFRGYHGLSLRLGLALSRILGRLFLTLFFLCILTPMGFVLRLAGKDLLQLKRPRDAATFWQIAKPPGPLDRLF